MPPDVTFCRNRLSSVASPGLSESIPRRKTRPMRRAHYRHPDPAPARRPNRRPPRAAQAPRKRAVGRAWSRADHRRLRRRSIRHRHLFAGRRAVRLRDVLGHAVHLPADGGDPGDQRTYRPGNRAGTSPATSARTTRSRCCARSSRCCSSPTSSIWAPTSARWATLVALLIGGSPHLYVVGFAIGCAALETFSRYERYVVLLKWSSALPAGLRRYRAGGGYALGPGRARYRSSRHSGWTPTMSSPSSLFSAPPSRRTVSSGSPRRKPRMSGSIRTPRRCWTRRSRRRSRSAASAWIPMSGWDTPT